MAIAANLRQTMLSSLKRSSYNGGCLPAIDVIGEQVSADKVSAILEELGSVPVEKDRLRALVASSRILFCMSLWVGKIEAVVFLVSHGIRNQDLPISTHKPWQKAVERDRL